MYLAGLSEVFSDHFCWLEGRSPTVSASDFARYFHCVVDSRQLTAMSKLSISFSA